MEFHKACFEAAFIMTGRTLHSRNLDSRNLDSRLLDSCAKDSRTRDSCAIDLLSRRLATADSQSNQLIWLSLELAWLAGQRLPSPLTKHQLLYKFNAAKFQ